MLSLHFSSPDMEAFISGVPLSPVCAIRVCCMLCVHTCVPCCMYMSDIYMCALVSCGWRGACMRIVWCALCHMCCVLRVCTCMYVVCSCTMSRLWGIHVLYVSCAHTHVCYFVLRVCVCMCVACMFMCWCMYCVCMGVVWGVVRVHACLSYPLASSCWSLRARLGPHTPTRIAGSVSAFSPYPERIMLHFKCCVCACITSDHRPFDRRIAFITVAGGLGSLSSCHY